MWDILMGQGLGQLLPPPPSTTTTSSSSTIVVRTPPQSDGVAIQSPNSGSVDARPDKVSPIPSPIAADAAESLKFGSIDSGCIVNPTAKPDKAPRPTVEYLSSKLKTVTSVQKLDGASIQLDLGCSCSKSDKVLGTPPSIFDAIEDEAGDFSGLDDADPKSNKVPPPLSSTVNFFESLSIKSDVEYDSKILEVKPTGWEDEEISKKAVPMTNMDGDGEGVKYPTGWEDEEISKKAILMTNKDGDGEGVKYPTGWEDEKISKKAVPMTNMDGDGEGVKNPTRWEDEEISKKAVLMTNKDGDGEGVKYPTGWEDEEISKKALPMTNMDGDGEGVKYPTGWEDEEISKNAVLMTNKDGNGEGVKHPTWCGAEVNPTGWEDDEISKKAVPMTNEDGKGEGVKCPTWWGVEVSPTGWEDEEISKKAVPMTNEDGNSEVVNYPTWRGVEVKPTGWEDEEISKKATGWEDEEISKKATGWEDEEISKKAVPMTNKDGNGEGVQYPIRTTGWEDGERSDKAFLKPNKDGSCEGVKYPERSAVKYPERPGQPDCSFYVHTGICKFGLNCKFNHPAIRKTRAKAKPKKPPEPIQMGISKLPMTSSTEEPVLGLSAPFHCPPAVIAAAEAYPQSKILKEELEGKSHGDNYRVQRLEEKSNPEESTPSKEGKSETDFPLRPGKPDCSYYLNTGNCQFGSNCRFNHPLGRKGSKKDVKEHIKNAPLGKTGNPESKADKGKQSKTLRGRTGQTERKINTRQYSVPGGNKFGTSSKHAHFPGKTEPGPVELNFLGLPIRPGERECTNYMHTGVCKFATNCRFHHPNPTPVTAEDTLSASQNAASPQQHASGASPLPTTSWTLPNASCGPLPYPSPPYTPGFYPLPSQGIYRHPGWSEYQVPTIPSFPPEMNSGHGHVAAAHQPRHERPGQATCHSFAKTGYCKFKSACKYCHPKASTESTDGYENLHR